MVRESLPKLSEEPDPGAFFPSLQREVNRLFDQFREGSPLSEIASDAVFGPAAFPAIDVVDTDESLEVSAEVPGVEEDDLDVSISGQTLTIKGKKSSEHEEKKDSFHRIERRYGSFRRSLPLGFTPETGAIAADFSKGVLKLTIRKPPPAQAEVQKIDIRKS